MAKASVDGVVTFTYDKQGKLRAAITSMVDNVTRPLVPSGTLVKKGEAFADNAKVFDALNVEEDAAFPPSSFDVPLLTEPVLKPYELPPFQDAVAEPEIELPAFSFQDVLLDARVASSTKVISPVVSEDKTNRTVGVFVLVGTLILVISLWVNRPKTPDRDDDLAICRAQS